MGVMEIIELGQYRCWGSGGVVVFVAESIMLEGNCHLGQYVRYSDFSILGNYFKILKDPGVATQNMSGDGMLL